MKQPEALRLADWLKVCAIDHVRNKQAAAELRRLHEVNQELLDACYAVLHDCDDIDMVESNEPGREKGPWQMLNEAIAKATGGQS